MSKYSSFKKDKLIFENWRKYLSEEADPRKMSADDFPMKLSDVGAEYTPQQAKQIATSGLKDGDKGDDQISASTASFPVKNLKPSQSSMNIGKAVAFAIAAILKNKPFPNGPGGNLGAMIDKDSHIMDGHHRWIASGMVNPDSEVGGYQVQFPAEKLIPILNILTLHFTKSAKGKPGGGSFEAFNEAGIGKVLQKYAKEGVWSANEDPKMVMKALEEFTGQSGQAAISAAAKKMADNVSQLTLSVPAGFPEREDMPIISAKKGHLDLAVKLLNSGAIDVNPKYAGKSGEPGGIVPDSGGIYKKGADSDAGYDEEEAKRQRMMRNLEENKKPKRRKK